MIPPRWRTRSCVAFLCGKFAKKHNIQRRKSGYARQINPPVPAVGRAALSCRLLLARHFSRHRTLGLLAADADYVWYGRHAEYRRFQTRAGAPGAGDRRHLSALSGDAARRLGAGEAIPDAAGSRRGHDPGGQRGQRHRLERNDLSGEGRRRAVGDHLLSFCAGGRVRDAATDALLRRYAYSGGRSGHAAQHREDRSDPD